MFAVVPAVTPDLAASTYLVGAEGAVLRLGAVVRASAATPTASGSAAARSRRASPATRGACWCSTAFGASPTGRTAAIVTENSPTGQYELAVAHRRRSRAPSSRSVYGKASLGAACDRSTSTRSPTRCSTSNGGNAARLGVRASATSSNVLGDAAGAARQRASSACSPTRSMYGPNLVAPAVGVDRDDADRAGRERGDEPRDGAARRRRAEDRARPIRSTSR